jgi:hypothetical protein
MRKFDVQIALEAVAEARHKWGAAQREFQTGMDKVLDRLIHEAVANFMSVEEFARYSGLSPKRVRDIMRRNHLTPKSGKTLLAKTAATALESNAALMGIAPHEMDLLSPLAYLPMGKQLKRELQNQTVSQVHELDEPVSGNAPLIHGINYRDHEVGCGTSAYRDPLLISNDIDQLTCEGCKRELIKGYDWASE